MITSYSSYLDLRVEWLKSRARYLRWAEEVVLVPEEMRRAVQYCRWRAGWWKEQGQRRVNDTADILPTLAEGLVAYAAQQADIEESRGAKWAAAWAPLLEQASLVRKRISSMEDEDVFIPELSLDSDDTDDDTSNMSDPEMDDED